MNRVPALRSAAMPSYFPILLGAHIILAVSLVLPSILLPFALRTRRAAVESGTPSSRACSGRRATARSRSASGWR